MEKVRAEAELKRTSKICKVFTKFALSLLMVLFLFLLGISSGLGYHVYHIEELSFEPNYGFGYAEAVFSCDIICNPILYPANWLVGEGHISGTFSTIYVPDAYSVSGSPFYGGPTQRYSEYIMQIIAWGNTANLVILLSINVAIEIVGKRTLYLSFFFGTFGFFIAELVGAIIGSITGVLLAFALNDFLVQLWRVILGVSNKGL